MPSKPKLLFISPEPVWLGHHGGHHRMLAMISLLSRKYQLDKLAIGKNFNSMGSPQDWMVIDNDINDAITSSSFHENITNNVIRNNYEVVYFNYYYFSKMASAMPDKVKTVCDLHDIQHLRAQAFSELGMTAPNQVSMQEELAALEQYNYLVSINYNESEYLENKINTPIVTIPHTADFNNIEYKKNRRPMIVGSMAAPNQDGFRQMILPAINNNIITWPVLIAGGISMLASEDITGLIIPMGTFKNAADVYPYASVSLAALRFGGGLKIKVIEALLHGIPVAGTSCAFDGISDLPSDVFYQFKTIEELADLNDFISQSKRDVVRDYAITNYAPDNYLEHIEF